MAYEKAREAYFIDRSQSLEPLAINRGMRRERFPRFSSSSVIRYIFQILILTFSLLFFVFNVVELAILLVSIL